MIVSARMIDASFVRTMAEYNQWQNKSIYGAADLLSDEDRCKDRGAVFRSIHETLSHLLWGDQIWMNRFADLPMPKVDSIAKSASMVESWEPLKSRRLETDAAILDWASSVSSVFLNGSLSWYSGSQKRNITCSAGTLVVHMFNHQTHHRGQVHAMITAAGGKPEDTDLFILKMQIYTQNTRKPEF